MSNSADEIMLVYNQIKDWVDNTEKPDASNIIILVTLLIKCVENVAKDKKGSYKKDLVLKVLTKVINESKLEPDAKAALMIMVQTTIPIMIDTMISIANQELDLGKIKTNISKCFCF